MEDAGWVRGLLACMGRSWDGGEGIVAMPEDANGEVGALPGESGAVLGRLGMEDRHGRLDCSTAGMGGGLKLGEVGICGDGVRAISKLGASKLSSASFGCLRVLQTLGRPSLGI